MATPFITPSAHKHGVDEETILHAFNNPIRAMPARRQYLS